MGCNSPWPICLLFTVCSDAMAHHHQDCLLQKPQPELLHISHSKPNKCTFGLHCATLVLTFAETTIKHLLFLSFLGVDALSDCVDVNLCFRLKMYVHASFDHVKVFMKAEGRKANSVR